MAGFIIHNHEGIMLCIRGKLLFQVSIPLELQAAWYGVKIVISEVHASKIWLERDSTTIVS